MQRTSTTAHPASIEVVPGLRLPPSVEVEVHDWRGVDLAAVVTFTSGRAVVSELHVTQRDGGPAITGELLRLLSVKAFVKSALSHRWNDLHELGTPVAGVESVGWGLLPVDVRDRLRASGPTEGTLRWVAMLYRVALMLEEPPTKSVSGVFEIAQSTAGQWVAAARRRSFLGPSEGSGKAGG